MGGMTAGDYLRQLFSLLPKGLAWARRQDSHMGRLLQAVADVFVRVDERMRSVLREIDPRQAVELLPDYERVLGLPDPCISEEQSIAQRQAAAYAKLTAQGGASKPYFIKLAADMGYPGASVEVYREATCNSDCNAALWPEDHRFYWQLNLPSDGGTFLANCNSPCDSALGTWGDTALECRVNQIKPGETDVAFAYKE